MDNSNEPLFNLIHGSVIPNSGNPIHPNPAPPPQDMNSFTVNHISRLHSDAQRYMENSLADGRRREGEHAKTAEALISFLREELRAAKEETRIVRAEMNRELDSVRNDLALARDRLRAKEAEADAQLTFKNQEWADRLRARDTEIHQLKSQLGQYKRRDARPPIYRYEYSPRPQGPPRGRGGFGRGRPAAPFSERSYRRSISPDSIRSQSPVANRFTARTSGPKPADPMEVDEESSGNSDGRNSTHIHTPDLPTGPFAADTANNMRAHSPSFSVTTTHSAGTPSIASPVHPGQVTDAEGESVVSLAQAAGMWTIKPAGDTTIVQDKDETATVQASAEQEPNTDEAEK